MCCLGHGSGITVQGVGHHPAVGGVASSGKYQLDPGSVHAAPPACKRPATLFEDEHRFLSQLGVPTARLKMTTQSQYTHKYTLWTEKNVAVHLTL